MADHDTHDHTGIPGVTGTPSDILDIPTAEMDDTLVLAPDGAGGVEFRAEAGGGGGLTQAYVGTTSIGGTAVAPSATNRWFMKKITLANDCVLTAIEFYVQQTGDVELQARVGMWDDTAGNPEHALTVAIIPVVAEESPSGPRDARWYGGAIGRWLTAGDYWIGASPGHTSCTMFYDGSGTDREFTPGSTGFGGQIGDYGLWTPSTTTRNYSIRANTIR